MQVNTTPDEILTRLVARLIDQIPEANESTCYISAKPEELPPNPGDWILTVSPGQPGFTETFQGGGQATLETSMTFTITIHGTHQNDEPGHSANFFGHAQRGLFPMFVKVAKALLDHELENEDGVFCLNESIHPGQGNWVSYDRARNWIQLIVELTFDWDLS